MPQVPTIEVIKFVLWVRDMERAVRFFRDVMGLTVRFQSDGWSEVGRGDVVIGLHAGADEQPRQTGLSFQVTDLDATIAAVTAAGVQVTQAPTTRQGNRFDWQRFSIGKGTSGCSRNASDLSASLWRNAISC